MTKVMISGGGTGGHVFPALAIAEALLEMDSKIDIRFIGALGKLEMEKVPKAGFPISGLWISGLHRRKIWRNWNFPFKLLFSLIKVFTILRKFKPDVVVGVGGYASGPTLELAYRMGIPTLIQEQNSLPGITNRLLKNKAKKICVAFDGMEKYFPKDKIVLTGNPVRNRIAGKTIKRAEGQAYFNLNPSRKTILMFGGSLGARSFNQSVVKNTNWWKKEEQLQLIWQCGDGYFENYKNEEVAQLQHVQLHPFLEQMEAAYAAADIIIARAGALTIAELCFVGKPVILVPSPNVAEDHQTYNAKALEQRGAARLLPDDKVDTVFELAQELVKEPGKMAEKIREMAPVGAANKIAKEVLDLIPGA